MNRLVYINNNERKETTDFNTGEITYKMIEPFLTSDILLFNFISGYDVSFETMKRVRKNSKSLIFVDVHSLVLKKTNGVRSFQNIKNWEEWAKNTDIIQMNTKELLFFTNRWKSTINKLAVKETILSLLKTGVKIVLVTSGEQGTYLGYKDKVLFFKQKYKSLVKDTTGCGDIFSSSFISKYIITKDPLLSSECANLISGLATKDFGLHKCTSVKFFKNTFY